MTEIFEQLVKKYRVFYEVSPFHVLVEEAHGSPTATRHIIQAGFDVDVQGISNKDELELPPPSDYALGYARLKEDRRYCSAACQRMLHRGYSVRFKLLFRSGWEFPVASTDPNPNFASGR